jgi:hypothetical protein
MRRPRCASWARSRVRSMSGPCHRRSGWAAWPCILTRWCPGLRLELMDLVNTSGLQRGRRPHDRAAAAQDGQVTPGILRQAEESPQRRLDLPLLRHQPPGVRQVAPPPCRARPDGLQDRSSRPRSAQQDPHQGRGQAHLPAPERPLRPGQDLDPPQELPRPHDLALWVWRVRKRLDRNRLPASQRHQRHDRRWQRYAKPLPGHRVQRDLKFIAPWPAPRLAPAQARSVRHR